MDTSPNTSFLSEKSSRQWSRSSDPGICGLASLEDNTKFISVLNLERVSILSCWNHPEKNNLIVWDSHWLMLLLFCLSCTLILFGEKIAHAGTLQQQPMAPASRFAVQFSFAHVHMCNRKLTWIPVALTNLLGSFVYIKGLFFDNKSALFQGSSFACMCGEEHLQQHRCDSLTCGCNQSRY